MYELHAPNEPVRRPGEDVDEHLSDGALTRAAGDPTPRSGVGIARRARFRDP